MSSIMMVPKKNGKIMICQDFQKLNMATKKDYFLLSFTDSNLDTVARHECYSFFDGFLEYNQINIAKEDQLKTVFTTDWSTFTYKVMPFGLYNAPTTFQWVMIQAYQDYLRILIEIFLDDFCTFSTMAEHLGCLDNYLNQCDKFGISLNSEKCQFGVPSGKLLGHIVSVEGIAIDPDKVTRILNLSKPDTVSGMRGFIGHINYYWHFIEFFAIICQPLTNLLKKPSLHGSSLIWTEDCTFTFDELK